MGDAAEVDAEEEPPRLAVIGRPNVGKSSLVNRILGEERVIVSEQAGTTRDSIDTRLEVDGRPLVLVDTAGLRRRGKVAGTVDWYAQLRSERAAERADVALVVCDASEGVTSDDFRVAELAMKSGCATVIVLNKWDIEDVDLEFTRARVAQKLRLRPKVMTASAKTGRGIKRLLDEALALSERVTQRIPTPELNRFLGDLQATRDPPAVRGKRLRHLLHGPVRRAPAAVLDPGERSRATDALVWLLPGESAAGALRARGGPAGDRLQDVLKRSVALLALAVLAPLAGCGGDTTDDHVVASVPANARAYLHLDRGSDDWESASEALARLPVARRADPRPARGQIEVPGDGEAGVALLPGREGAGRRRARRPAVRAQPGRRSGLQGAAPRAARRAVRARSTSRRPRPGSCARSTARSGPPRWRPTSTATAMRIRARVRHEGEAGPCDETQPTTPRRDRRPGGRVLSSRCRRSDAHCARSRKRFDGVGRGDRRLRARGAAARRVSLEDEVMPLLEHRGALIASPGKPAPILTFVVDDVDETRGARRALAASAGADPPGRDPGARPGADFRLGRRRGGDGRDGAPGARPRAELRGLGRAARRVHGARGDRGDQEGGGAARNGRVRRRPERPSRTRSRR